MRALTARFGPAVFLAAYFFWFAGGGLWARFTGDDLMNLEFHLTPSFPRLLLTNLTYWTTAYRPMGGIFYVAVYRLAGFHSMPFRVVCFVLLLANLWLFYRVCLRLTERREAALLATLLATYHAWLVNLYYSTGTVYELLCYGFYFAAFDYYLGIRQAGKTLGVRQWVCFLALYLAALDSKEMAVTLPLAILCYELLWHGGRGSVRGVAISAFVTLPYVIGKMTGAQSLANNPLYRPSISPAHYLHAFHLYLNVLFYQDHFFRDANTILLVVAMLAVAAWRRSRPLLFAWCFILFSVLPFIFIPHYTGFFLYIPIAGWALYIATGMEMLRQRYIRRLPAAAIFLTLAAGLAAVNLHESPRTMQVFTTMDIPSTEMIAQLRNVQPAMRRGAHVYFESDPFPPKTYSLLFLVRLVYDDLSIDVARAADGDPQSGGNFDAVYRWDAGRLVKEGR
ncbi:MAG TPA: glycosyltransferase family 39 protein [Bryobacteraceae bacterium]|nr:glycosyltransferase family 39 protein [Bryobacteraceae bacterium]